MNERFHNAIHGRPQAVPPIWFMRQAGRYHKHYQGLRKAHGFMELCKNSRLAAEVALGPIEDFDFDVAILFSDLLFPLEAMGMGLKYDPAPKLGWHLSESNLKDLRTVDRAIQDLAFQKEALEATRKVLPKNKSLIGFVGGPWTLFTYAVEGEHKGSLRTAKTNWPLFHRFCEVLVPLLIKNIELQIAGGAEVVMMFDTAAGEVSPLLFKSEIQPYIIKLAGLFPGRTAYYSKGTTPAHLTDLRQKTFFAGLGVDHRFDIVEELKREAPGFVQGNFDQTLLFTREPDFTRRLRDYLQGPLMLTEQQRRHWVCGLGHGVLPETPEENVRTFIKIVREEFSR